MLKFFPFHLNFRDTFDTPADTKINLLPFPVLDENNTPKAIDNRVDRGEGAQKNPGGKAKCCRKDEERKIGLGKGKVERNLVLLSASNMPCNLFQGSLLTFSPNLSRISSRSSALRNVIVLHFLIHSLLKR